MHFVLNILESKASIQNCVLKHRESDFRWLVEEYKNRNEKNQYDHGVQTFEQFADIFLKDLLEKMNAAKRILTL
jgi:hypothetical protein